MEFDASFWLGVVTILLTHLVGGVEKPDFLPPEKTHVSVGDFAGGLKVFAWFMFGFPSADFIL